MTLKNLNNSFSFPDDFYEALCFLTVAELKFLCQKVGVSAVGKKGDIIARLRTYFKTGETVSLPAIPSASKAQKGKESLLSPETLILKGVYKNDLKTRAFMKTLVGDDFHFTAFGQDWIKERWIVGNPPTYGEFARFWRGEKTRRQRQKAQPKEEWAYLNFTQQYLEMNPQATRQEITQAWEQERQRKVQLVKDYFNAHCV